MVGSKDKALEKIRRLEETIEKKKAALIQAKGRLTEKEKKVRNKAVFKAGCLVMEAGILETDEETLLGALMHVRERLQDEAAQKSFRTAGKKALREKTKT